MCAMTVAEGHPLYKTDVSIVLSSGKNKSKTYVLRTTLDSYKKWRLKYMGIKAFDISSKKPGEVKLIDKEVWVFNVDATKAEDIITAVEIAVAYYRAQGATLTAKDIMGNVYVKSLNIENEGETGLQSRGEIVKANKALYKNVALSVKAAGQHFNFTNVVFRAFNSANNTKLSCTDLRLAMVEAGAKSAVTNNEVYRVISGDNDGIEPVEHDVNLTIAVLPME